MTWGKELAVFLGLLLLLAPVFHPDLLRLPAERVDLLFSRGNVFHPILYTLIAYLLIGLIRIFFYGLRKLWGAFRPN